jgi:hypothetical protein
VTAARMMSAHGLSVAVPSGWEARITRRSGGAPYLHVASIPLHGDAGQFGAAVTGAMGPDAMFAALIEYLVDDQVRPGHGLFAGQGWRPRLRVADFARTRLQVTRAGHLGHQRFFTAAGRPMCLYAVIAPVRRRPAQLVGELSAVLETVRVA